MIRIVKWTVVSMIMNNGFLNIRMDKNAINAGEVIKSRRRPYEKKSSNFRAIFVQLHTETVQFLQFLGQKPPYNFCKKTKT